MLPVVRGDAETTRQIVLYSLVLVGLHARRRLLARPGLLGRGRVSSAASSSASRGSSAESRRGATRASLFHYSLLYLALLFVAAALDPVIL